MGRRSAQLGNQAEDLARNRLRSEGVILVEKVGTPVKTLRNSRTGKISEVIYGEKVSCDIRGLLPDGSGRAVYVEVKETTGTDRLVHSRLEDHQVEWLDRADEAGAVSLLCWVNDWGVYFVRWPVDGFTFGTSLKLEQANANQWRMAHEPA